MTDHQPPPAVELPINDPTNPAHRLADDLRRGRIPGYAAEDVRAVLESLRHSVEREAGLAEALAYLAGEKNDAGERAWDGRAWVPFRDIARAALDRRAGT